MPRRLLRRRFLLAVGRPSLDDYDHDGDASTSRTTTSSMEPLLDDRDIDRRDDRDDDYD